MDIKYECCICGRVVDDAVPAEDTRGNLIFICYPDYLTLEWKYEDE